MLSHLLVGIWFPWGALGRWCSWLGPEKSPDFDAWQELSPLIMMVALLAVWSSLSTNSKVMLGSMVLEEPSGKAWTVFWASGVHWRGNMPSSTIWVLVIVRGLCGGRDAHRFLLIGILGSGSCFISVWFPLPKKTKKTPKPQKIINKVNQNDTYKAMTHTKQLQRKDICPLLASVFELFLLVLKWAGLNRKMWSDTLFIYKSGFRSCKSNWSMFFFSWKNKYKKL